MTDDEMERARITMNVIGAVCNACSHAEAYIRAAWDTDEIDLFTRPAAREAVLAFLETFPAVKEKEQAAYEELAKCYRR